MHNVNGGCYCGNICVELQLTAEPATYRPRACDCDFCCKHGAVYVSDARGSLLIRVQDKSGVSKFRQGNELADFLLCRTCGVLVAVLLRSEESLHGTVNVKALENAAAFGAPQTVSPKKLSGDEKVKRWRGVWFSNVKEEAPGRT